MNRPSELWPGRIILYTVNGVLYEAEVLYKDDPNEHVYLRLSDGQDVYITYTAVSLLSITDAETFKTIY